MHRKNLPLKIIRPRVSMLLTRAEWTDISRGIVNEPVSNHLIFTFEPLPTNTSRAAFNWTIVGTILRMHIGMGAVVRKN